MSKFTDEQIKQMVDRFLTWKLPADFNPDNGITFDKVGGWDAYEYVREPTGTNLLTATQAEAMVRHLIADSPTVVDALRHFDALGKIGGTHE